MFRQDFTCPALLESMTAFYPYGAITHYGPPFQTVPVLTVMSTGLVRVRSPLLAESRLMSFPPGTEMFQFPGFASTLCIQCDDLAEAGGFPHSEILGSKLVRSSPRLIAAYHVLHRLSAPRHPPDALKSLDRSHYQCPSSMRLTDLGRPVADVIDRKTSSLCKICLSAMRSSCRPRVRQPLSTRRPDKSLLHDVNDANGSRRIRNCFERPQLLRHRGCLTRWWSQTGSNRRPHACKAGALPTELWPRCHRRLRPKLVQPSRSRQPTRLRPATVIHQALKLVGPGRLELPTSRLSGVRSNHLSYRPEAALEQLMHATRKKEKRRRRASRQMGALTAPLLFQ